ncbi:MAG: hypothetical protein HY681_06805 [Chloroflexi bacterium]|nr:hypothetical protein [Chloroflexota bacterium]
MERASLEELVQEEKGRESSGALDCQSDDGVAWLDFWLNWLPRRWRRRDRRGEKPASPVDRDLAGVR